MFLRNLFVAAATGASLASCALNTSQEFFLKTQVKDGQEGKESFDNLYLYAYHTGAGLNDAMLSSDKGLAIKTFFNSTDLSTSDGVAINALEVELGSLPYSLSAAHASYYAGWDPVRINAGVHVSEYNGFYANETGLQFTTGTSYNSFNGWYVCKWWHDGEPQLFYRLKDYGHTELASCADVNLVQEMI